MKKRGLVKSDLDGEGERRKERLRMEVLTAIVKSGVEEEEEEEEEETRTEFKLSEEESKVMGAGEDVKVTGVLCMMDPVRTM